MTDRPTTPTDRPVLRPAAPDGAAVADHRPTTRTDRPTDRQSDVVARLRPVGSGTDRSDSTDTDRRPTDADPTDSATPTGRFRRWRKTKATAANTATAANRPTDPTDSATPTGRFRRWRKTKATAANRPTDPTAVAAARRPTNPAQPTTTTPTNPANSSPSRATRIGMRILLASTALLLAVVVTAPISLSAQDLVGWAESPTGLGLDHFWAVVVFIALDAAAGVCVLLSVYCAWRGEPAGGFGLAVWVFALTSAFANYQHGSRPGAPGDAWWFFPAMSLLGPALLEMVTRKVREWAQRNSNRRGKRMPHFGWRRWIPGVGSWRDTYGAYRTANLLGIETVDLAIAWYHWLCPDGSLRVAKAMRERGVHADRLPTDRPAVAPTDEPTVESHRPTPAPTDPASARPTITVQSIRPTAVEPTAPRPTVARPTVPASTDRPTPTAPTAPTQRTGDRPTVPAPMTPTTLTGQTDFTPAAIRNAAIIRSRYGNLTDLRLPTVRGDLGWSYDRADPALRAYLAGADRPTGVVPAPTSTTDRAAV